MDGPDDAFTMTMMHEANASEPTTMPAKAMKTIAVFWLHSRATQDCLTTSVPTTAHGHVG